MGKLTIFAKIVFMYNFLLFGSREEVREPSCLSRQGASCAVSDLNVNLSFDLRPSAMFGLGRSCHYQSMHLYQISTLTSILCLCPFNRMSLKQTFADLR